MSKGEKGRVLKQHLCQPPQIILHIKAALINIYIFRRGYIIMCNVNVVAHSHKPTDNYHHTPQFYDAFRIFEFFLSIVLHFYSYASVAGKKTSNTLTKHQDISI